MVRPLANRVTQIIRHAVELYLRLVMPAVGAGKKTSGLQAVHESTVASLVNINIEPSRCMLDFTERSRALDALQETKDMLIQFEKEAVVGRLVVGIAHELLNPVSIISSRLQFMEDEILAEQARENVRICREQLQRITKIVQDLHQSSAVQPRLHVGSYMRDVIQLSLTMTESRIREDQVCVVYHRLPVIIPVKMEKDRMSKVMVHLILNACDAMLNTDQKRLIITVQDSNAIDKPSAIVLIVADNGCGVPEGDIKRIFDPFFTTKEPGKGTGLGLSICKNIIAEHRGTIHVENNDMGGASFIVELPLSRA
jgi:C4-dicarboxylate-specific signal transduction histidine kinase